MTAASLPAEPVRWSVPYAASLARLGRSLFAAGLVGFAIGNVMVGDFIAGRAPAWPAAAPGRLPFVYLTALLFVGAAAWIVRRSREIWPLVAVAATITVWALLRQIPAVLADHGFGGAWTMFGKALAFSGGTLGVAASVLGAAEPAAPGNDGRRATMDLLGRLSLGAFFVLAGIQHFMFAQFVMTLVPAWIPGALIWTYIAGAALIASGVGLAFPPTSRLAAAMSGLMVLSWVFVLHIPRAVSMNNQNEWTAVAEAVAIAGMALAMVRGE
ncbi:MAG TPA: hypothetical protein VGP25_09350 [Gemmatimonadaceae bacterium]|nr:hypothetical protein [Gemmatimonadaceae bacterium]